MNSVLIPGLHDKDSPLKDLKNKQRIKHINYIKETENANGTI